MTRFSLRFWRCKPAAIALIAAALAAPLAASPALAEGWDHGRGESRAADWYRESGRHLDRDDGRRPVTVAPARVYRMPVSVAPAYPPPVHAPSSAYAAPPPPFYAPASCSNAAIAGGLVGAATGGFVGAQFGHASGNAAATIFAILGGAAIGASFGQAAAGCY